MRVIIHRGTREIGGSCVEVMEEKTRIVLDIGLPLVKKNGERFEIEEYAGLKGPELVRKGVLPHLKGFYEWDTDEDPVKAFFLSHAHLDHYGFLKFVRKDIPCYMGEGTKRLIETTNYFLRSEELRFSNVSLSSGEKIQVGDFAVTPFLMDHSAFDAYAFLIESETKKLIYSGDFREHGRKEKAFRWFLHNAPKRVDVLLLEGSLFGRQSEKQKSENEIENDVVAAIGQSKGIVFLVAAGQNIDRLVSFYKASARTKRLFVVDVYTANVLGALKDLARIPHPSPRFDNLKVFFPYHLCRKLTEEGKAHALKKFRQYRISKDEISEQASRIVMMVRPSMLFDLRRIANVEGATIIYSMWEGYLRDRPMERLLEFAMEKKMSFLKIHTSGHASIETLKKVVSILKPKSVIPIHTFYPNKYKDLFSHVREAEDGVDIAI